MSTPALSTCRGCADAGPWRLRIDQGGKAIQAVLRVGDPSRRQQLATEATALGFAEAHRLAAPRLLAVDLDGAAAGVPVLVQPGLNEDLEAVLLLAAHRELPMEERSDLL